MRHCEFGDDAFAINFMDFEYIVCLVFSYFAKTFVWNYAWLFCLPLSGSLKLLLRAIDMR